MKKMAIYSFVLAGALFLGCKTGSVYIGNQRDYHPYTATVPGYTCPKNNGVGIYGNISSPGNQQRTLPMAPTPSGLLGPAHQNTYGPGTWSDSTGRPFHWQTQSGQRVPFGRVKPDAYGPGIGMDIYGRPVRVVPG